ncbi:hypothetical protein DAMA08_029350 [Martiniozyma asiatica (nom. inval.)]|nr:hypothetical protein DAMA08_029350 [Martiniozyma asiatica]
MARASRSPIKSYGVMRNVPQEYDYHNFHQPVGMGPGTWVPYSSFSQPDPTSHPSFIHLHKRYQEQNKILAQTAAKLQTQVKELQNELNTAKKEIRMLKAQKSKLALAVNDGIKNFKELVECGARDLEQLYQNMTDLPDKEMHLFVSESHQPVADSITSNISTDYLKEVNQDLKRRKSDIFSGSANMPLYLQSQLDSRISKEPSLPPNDLEEVVEQEEPEPEPVYQDTEHKLIPMKKTRESALFAPISRVNSDLGSGKIDLVPNLAIDKEATPKKITPNEAAAVTTAFSTVDERDDNCINKTGDTQEADSNYIQIPTFKLNDQSIDESDVSHSRKDFDIPDIDNSPDCATPSSSPQKNQILANSRDEFTNNSFIDKISATHSAEAETESDASLQNKKKSIPRELKNLDTEKTRRWLGVTEGKRRASIGVKYGEFDLNGIGSVIIEKKKKKVSVYSDKENEPSKLKSADAKVKKQPLKNITNLRKNKSKTAQKQLSIFDLDSQDSLGLSLSPTMPIKQGKRGRKKANDFIL